MGMKPKRGKKGMKGMERIGQYNPEESIPKTGVPFEKVFSYIA